MHAPLRMRSGLARKHLSTRACLQCVQSYGRKLCKQPLLWNLARTSAATTQECRQLLSRPHALRQGERKFEPEPETQDSKAVAGPVPSPDSSAASSSGTPDTASTATKEDTVPVKVALAMLRFYKAGISPLLPSSCRYLPTCSEYSMDSYRKFGVWKGTVLTAWRLLRCNPWGSSGYDPPVWPPKGLELVYGKVEYAPQVTVVLGAGLFVYLVQGLLHELGL
mmetsp:Transcript_6293/g.13852  ORF Transcript_6293/g.13852 Transcript_6293/m.13852 type:complete len:222 (-) Transcript_6293:472-1137(-)